jgi:universal stress protein E
MATARWRSILAVVTDPFATEQLAARKAAAIARRCGAKLTLLNTFMIPQPVSDAAMDSQPQIIESAKRQRRVQLEQLAKKWRGQGVKVKVLVEWDYPAHEAIIRAVQRERPDLLVAHSHRHGRLARWVLANTDWELMRHCPCALWFVRSDTLPARPSVVVAVDPRHTHAKPARLDDRLLNAAAALNDQLSGSLDVVHVYRAPPISTSGTLMEPFRLPSAAYAARDYVDRLRSDVERLAARHDVAATQCQLVDGDPTAALPAFVKRRKVDVLVMGVVSRSAIARPIIGNTAEKIIDHVDCDVFVVKPAGFKSSVPKHRSSGEVHRQRPSRVLGLSMA